MTKLDDDDFYGPEHIWDLVLARQYSGAELVGKALDWIYVESEDATVFRPVFAAEKYTDFVAGGTICLSKADLLAVGGWRPVPKSVGPGTPGPGAGSRGTGLPHPRPGLRLRAALRRAHRDGGRRTLPHPHRGSTPGACRARGLRHDAVMSEQWPRVNVVMTVINEERHLAHAVDRLLAQDYPGELDIVIAVGPRRTRRTPSPNGSPRRTLTFWSSTTPVGARRQA